jgi:acyl-CoA synthetase (AMP-forming)/AMP-acid ligase II
VLLEQKVVVVNPETLQRCSDNEVGEIWIAGDSVAQGYWSNPDETESTFKARVADIGEGPFLRTGDLGCVTGGELYITGRLKDLIIIRGRNHYPQDIELTAERSDRSLRPGCGAAFSVDDGGAERLVIVQEINYREEPNVQRGDWKDSRGRGRATRTRDGGGRAYQARANSEDDERQDSATRVSCCVS